MVAPRTSLVRIFATAKVDHLSVDHMPLSPICGQQRRTTDPWYRDVNPLNAGAVRLCVRCKALATGEVAD